jgi:hypothetical protein
MKEQRMAEDAYMIIGSIEFFEIQGSERSKYRSYKCWGNDAHFINLVKWASQRWFAIWGVHAASGDTAQGALRMLAVQLEQLEEPVELPVEEERVELVGRCRFGTTGKPDPRGMLRWESISPVSAGARILLKGMAADTSERTSWYASVEGFEVYGISALDAVKTLQRELQACANNIALEVGE